MALPKKKKTDTKVSTKDVTSILNSISNLATIALAFATLFKKSGVITIPERTEDFTYFVSTPK